MRNSLREEGLSVCQCFAILTIIVIQRAENPYLLTLCILMDSSFWFDTINLGESIVE